MVRAERIFVRHDKNMFADFYERVTNYDAPNTNTKFI